MEFNTKGHNLIHAAFIILASVVFILMVIFNALAAYTHTGLFVSEGIFNLSQKYETDLTPTDGTFVIWGLIHGWQVIWLLYAISTIFRQGAEGPLYRSPILLPVIFFGIYTVANIFHTVWLFFFDREYLEAAFIALLIVFVTLYLCIAISMVYLTRNLEFLTKIGLGKERWWIWIAVQNGLAIYATWATYLALLNLTIVIQFASGVSRITAGSIGLGFILSGIIFWSFFELIFLDKYTRYLVMPYLTLIWIFGGILVNHWDVDWTPSYRNAVIMVINLTFVAWMTLVKFALLFYRNYSKPLK